MPWAGSCWHPCGLLYEAQASLKVASQGQLGFRGNPRAGAFAHATEFLGFPSLLCFHSCTVFPSPSLRLQWLQGAP